MHRHARQHSAMSCAKMTKPVEMLFQLYAQVG